MGWVLITLVGNTTHTTHMKNTTTLPIGDFDKISQKLHSAVRALAFATQNPELTPAELKTAVYLLEQSIVDIAQFQVWGLKDSE